MLAQKRRSLLHQQEASWITYVAPEQLQGQPSPASDQYALGIVVYEWLSGDVPFHGSSQEIIQQHLSFSPLPLRGKNPAISSYVQDVVLKALAKNPGQRFASVQAFAAELEQACQATRHETILLIDPGARHLFNFTRRMTLFRGSVTHPAKNRTRAGKTLSIDSRVPGL